MSKPKVDDHVRRETVIPFASGGPVRERFSVSYGDHYDTFDTWEEAVAFFRTITNDSE